MPRKSRSLTSTGIYHVMLRGINKQNIFFSEDDYIRMMTILKESPFEVNQMTGKVLSNKLCTIYAYCILDNHVHILIREGEEKISDLMKKIEMRYALYYNKRYERVGHLFQARFESEAVNDAQYFYTLLRYIHRNPVKAQEAKKPEEYPYSSWNEYVNHPSNLKKVLKPAAMATVLRRYPLPELIEWVNMDVDDKCLDMDWFPNPISDREAFEILNDLTELQNPEDFRLLDAPTQTYFLLQAIDKGITIRQASRLGTVTRYQITKAYNKKQISQAETTKRGDSSSTGTDPVAEKNVEILRTPVEVLRRAMERVMANDENFKREKALQNANDGIRRIEGLSKKTYHRMHLIAEYLAQHPASKCQDIADHIEVSNERTRIILVQLSNANIVDIQGNARARTYSLNPIK